MCNKKLNVPSVMQEINPIHRGQLSEISESRRKSFKDWLVDMVMEKNTNILRYN